MPRWIPDQPSGGVAIAQRDQDVRLLADAGRVLASSVDLQTTLHSVARLAVPTLADFCAVHVYDDDRRLRWMASSHVVARKESLLRRLSRRYSRDGSETPLVRDVLRNGVPRLLREARREVAEGLGSSDLSVRRVERILDARSAMLVPLVARGEALGLLVLVCCESDRRFGPQDLDVAEDLASHAALAIEAVRLYHAEHRARTAAEQTADRMGRLQDLTAALSHAATPQEVARVTVDHLRQTFGALEAGVLELDPSGLRFQVLSATQEGSPDGGARAPEVPLSLDFVSPASEAARRGELVIRDGPPTGADPGPGRATRDTGRAGPKVAVPLVFEGAPVGVIAASFGTRRTFSAEDRSFLAALGHVCGQAIGRARLYERAQEANRAKTNFISTMSHEFRTPLAAIIGYAELLEAGVPDPLTKRQKEHLGRLRQSAWQLTGMVSDILMLSRLEAGREEIRPEPTELRELLRSTASAAEPVARRKGLEFRLRAPAESIRFLADAPKLAQMLENVLTNAIKFTAAGEVALSARVELPAGREGGSLCFAVQDTGIGIDAHHQKRIFDPFWQVDQSETRTAGGAGLGLAVTQRLARLMGGELRIASEPGGGTLVEIAIPYHPVNATSPAAARDFPDPGRATPEVTA